MAQFETQFASAAIAQAIKKLQENNMFSDKTVTAILTIGADEMLASVKSAFIQSGHNNTLPRRTGETLRHFTKSRKLMKDKRGTPYMFVTVSGSDRRGQRYGAKAFVLNYGRRKGGKITADYYLSNAAKSTRPKINQQMAQKAEELFASGQSK